MLGCPFGASKKIMRGEIVVNPWTYENFVNCLISSQ